MYRIALNVARGENRGGQDDNESARNQAIQCDLPQRVVSHLCDEADPAAERRQIMRHNRRRTSQRHAELGSQQFPFHRHLLRQSVENQIKVDLSGNGDIEFRQEEAPQKFPRPCWS